MRLEYDIVTEYTLESAIEEVNMMMSMFMEFKSYTIVIT